MNKLVAYGMLALALLAALTVPAWGDETKPIESPIHMTYLPVPDEFRQTPKEEVSAPVLARMGQNTSVPTKAPESGSSVEFWAGRDDTDAGLNHEGRRGK